MEDHIRFVTDFQNIIKETTLEVEKRLELARNIILFICQVQVDFSDYIETRKDTIIRVVAQNDEKTFSNANTWIQKCMYSRYYLSFLRRGLLNYLRTGNIEESAYYFRAYEEDILFCFDVLKETNMLDTVRSETSNEVIRSIHFTDNQIQDIIKGVEWNINYALKRIEFLFNNGVAERNFVESDLRMWAYRVVYMKEGNTDIVFLINFVRKSIVNRMHNIRDGYTAKKRNCGLVRTKKGESNATSDYQRLCVPLTDIISDSYSYEQEFYKHTPKEFLLTADIPDDYKKRIERFFCIMEGNDDKRFYEWLQVSNISLDMNSKDYDFKLREYAIEYLGIKDIIPMLKNACRIFYDSNCTFKKYKVKETLDDKIKKVYKYPCSKRLKQYVLSKNLSMYSDNFLKYLSDNDMSQDSLNRLSQKEIQEWLLSYYNKMSSSDVKIIVELEKLLFPQT